VTLVPKRWSLQPQIQSAPRCVCCRFLTEGSRRWNKGSSYGRRAGGAMNDGTYTLKMFFSLGGKPSPEVKSKIERNDQALLLREKISATMGKNGWSAAFEEIYKKATDLLDISVVDVLLGAWNRYQALKKYLDKEKYAPTQSILVPLSEHTVKSEHNPHVEILVNDEPVGKIAFQITLTFTVRGAILIVQDGKIKGIKTGEIKGKGTLKCEGVLLLEQDFRPIPLPGSVDLGDGIPITE
jgi:hypothetical protein